jgi:PAS domain S-box-containing protein
VIEKTHIGSTRAVKLNPDMTKLDEIADSPSAALPGHNDRLTPYGLAVALIVVVALFAGWLETHFVGAPVSLLLCAVMFSGWLGGLGPGLVAAGLAFLVFDIVFVAPLNSFTISALEIPRVFAFGVSAFLIGLLSGEQRRKAESLRCARDELADTYRELKMTNKALRQENTMRDQAEAALRESEQRFRDFAETGSDWLWETGPDHRITYISEHIHRIGVLPAKRLDFTRWEVAADRAEDDEKWRAHIAAHEAHAPFRDFVYSVGHDNGSRTYVKTSGKPVFDSAGRFQGYRGVGSDITAEIQHRRAEKALRQAHTELAHVTRVTMLGELTASIVHEVNQPLASIATNGDAALRFIQRGEPDIAEVQDALGDMINDCRRATDIIQRVRALCRRSDPQLVSLDLNKLIEDTIRLVQRELRDQGITLHQDLCSALPAVRGDRVEIQQVLINLVMNGLEAMAAVDQRARNLQIRSHQNGDQVLVAVEDSGIGIDAASIDRLFNSFYTTKPSGLGMGLSICRSIIEAHGGKLWASQNAGPGATFQFTLQAAA